ncbi:restriction endonuclease subunit S [Tepidanaerobacter syntrophicus]|uniref:restriction endonuclease subunit S n=1 Tax=Tepidanaerobacter syntrophicus TaxID=224999 RepID=UPI001BD4F51E|nr:restriction endonuclease subunit S [Tepidanaerobacter syntrophicus]
MSNFKRYDKYKDSGIEWIGEIPEGWEVIPLKRIFKIINGGTPNSSEESYWNGEIVWITPNDLSELTEIYIRDSERKITEDGINNCSAKIVPKDSIIISTRAPIGYIAIAAVDLCTNQGCKSLVPVSEINSKFFYYFILSINFYLNVLGQGTTFMELSNSNLSMVELLKPPLVEQISIANFLDQKTAEIDDLITDKEKLIELLQEKRQAVITEAVTKGLNPNVKMKDSGIEWIGDIPEGWNAQKIKYLADVVNIKAIDTDNNKTYIGLENIESKTGRLLTNNDEEQQAIGETANVFRKNDVLFGKLRPYLAKCIVASLDGRCTSELLVIRTHSKILPDYLHFLMLSSIFIELVDSSTYGAKMPRTSWNFIGNLKIPLPGVEEQKEIIQRLNELTRKIDDLVSEIQEQIQKLKEYRQTLIFEAVTGKIDVRDYAAVS